MIQSSGGIILKISLLQTQLMKTILLDRDGVINPYMLEDYVKGLSQWVWQPKAIEALQLLSQNNYRIIFVTNQSCINRKIVSYRTVHAIHEKIKTDLLPYGVTKVFFVICHHTDKDQCQCRKPNAENIFKLISSYRLDPKTTIFMGDSPSDMQAGQKANLQTIAIKSGNPKMEEYLQKTKQVHFNNLLEAVQSLFLLPPR